MRGPAGLSSHTMVSRFAEEYFGQFGDAVPAEMYAQLEVLREQLEAAAKA